MACSLVAAVLAVGCSAQEASPPPVSQPVVSSAGEGSAMVGAPSVDTSVSSSVPEASTGLEVEASTEGVASSSSGMTVPPRGSLDGGVSVASGGFRWVSAGLRYACGVRFSGVVLCWSWQHASNDSYGLDFDMPGGVFKSVDVGWEYACGIRSDDSLECWGQTPLADLEPPTGEFTQVSVGIEHACAVSVDGSLECWGRMERFRGSFRGRGAPLGGSFVDIVSGDTFRCGLRPGGGVECWGGGLIDVEPPGGTFAAVAAAGRDVCGVRLSGEVECWGPREAGEGTGYLSPPEGRFTQVEIAAGRDASESGFACGVRADASAACWGEGEVSLPRGEKFRAVYPSFWHVCGILSAGEARCWRRDDIAKEQVDEYPEIVPPTGEFAELEVLDEHDTLWCGLRPDGSMDCWGSRYRWGNQRVFPPWGPYTSVSSSGRDGYACAARVDSSVVCWDPPFNESSDTPGGEFTDVSVAFHSACGLSPSGEATCWGADREAGERSSKNMPPEAEFTSVNAGWGGDDFTSRGDPLTGRGLSCGIRADAAVECWGRRVFTYEDGIARGDKFTEVSVGRGARVCVQNIDGVVDCDACDQGAVTSFECNNICALNIDGVINCGKGRVLGLNYPQDKRFTQISMSGYSDICGLRRDGAVECWDSDAEPLGVIPGPFTQIDLGYNGNSDDSYACGLLADGRIICWELTEEVLKRAANGIDNYTKTRCQLRIFGDLRCWDPSGEAFPEADKPTILPDSELDNLLDNLLNSELENLLNRLLNSVPGDKQSLLDEDEQNLLNKLLNSVPGDEHGNIFALLHTVLFYTVLESPIFFSHP